jgi:hypothetical protein
VVLIKLIMDQPNDQLKTSNPRLSIAESDATKGQHPFKLTVTLTGI